jgi:hypothetical protein
MSDLSSVSEISIVKSIAIASKKNQLLLVMFSLLKLLILKSIANNLLQLLLVYVFNNITNFTCFFEVAQKYDLNLHFSS